MRGDKCVCIDILSYCYLIRQRRERLSLVKDNIALQYQLKSALEIMDTFKSMLENKGDIEQQRDRLKKIEGELNETKQDL